MTRDRARKTAIRAEMAVTGQSYSVVARARDATDRPAAAAGEVPLDTGRTARTRPRK